MQLTKEGIAANTKEILLLVQEAYRSHTSLNPNVFIILKDKHGEGVLKNIPLELLKIYMSAQRRLFIDLLRVFIGKIQAEGIEVVGFCQVAEAWMAHADPTEKPDDSVKIADARTKVAIHDRPDKVEILQVSYTMKDQTLNDITTYLIERNEQGRVTGLRKDKESQLTGLKTIFTELFE